MPVEKREGAFYVWSAADIDRLLGDDAALVRRRFGIEDSGNALADPQGEFTGQNILYVTQSIEDIAARTGRTAEDVTGALAQGPADAVRRPGGRVRGRISTTKSSRRGTG